MKLKPLLESILAEGVDDPGILKCIFLAGGPGSGKSYTANEIFGIPQSGISKFSAGGLKIVNSDIAFEKMLKDNGINPKDLHKISDENPEFYLTITGDKDSIRSRASDVTKKQQAFYETGRLGMILDGTGAEFEKIAQKKEKAESLGYDCYMVFINTTLDVALERNRKRSRQLPDDLVKETWNKCQNNLSKYATLFAGNFITVDNSVYKPVDADVQKAINSFLRRPIKNVNGKTWIETQRLIKAKKAISENANGLYLEKNIPTSPSKWDYAVSQAKKKFDVYPSAYANAWASKKYKELGGGWKKE